MRQGSLEGSGVDAAKVMVEMITSLRSFQSGQQAIQSIGQTLQESASQVGSLNRRRLMLEGLYSAAAGMSAQQEQLDAISNDLANISTTGYQSERVAFSDLLYNAVDEAGTESSIGAGASAQVIGRSQAQGPIQETGDPLDLAIEGEGYFQVKGPGGQAGADPRRQLRCRCGAARSSTPKATAGTADQAAGRGLGRRSEDRHRRHRERRQAHARPDQAGHALPRRITCSPAAVAC